MVIDDEIWRQLRKNFVKFVQEQTEKLDSGDIRPSGAQILVVYLCHPEVLAEK